MDGQRRPETSSGASGASAAPAVVDDPDHLAEPPDDLSRNQQEVWRRLACHAIAQRTLTPTTVPGFRELCEQFVVKQALFRRMERFGLASDKAEGARKRYEKMAQRVDSTLARFKLTAFGKPVDGASAAKKAGTNPWAQVAQ
jgi:phage terminase small subunit